MQHAQRYLAIASTGEIFYAKKLGKYGTQGDTVDPATVYAAARETFGQTVQTIVCIEELSELQKELCKVLREQPCPDHIAEEIADVQITTEQMMAAFGLAEKVKLYRAFKLKRLQERIEQAEWERDQE